MSSYAVVIAQLFFGALILWVLVAMISQWHGQRMCDAWNEGYERGRDDEKHDAIPMERLMR